MYASVCLQILAAVLGSVANLSTIKKVMMLLRTLRLFKVMRRIKVSNTVVGKCL